MTGGGASLGGTVKASDLHHVWLSNMAGGRTLGGARPFWVIPLGFVADGGATAGVTVTTASARGEWVVAAVLTDDSQALAGVGGRFVAVSAGVPENHVRINDRPAAIPFDRRPQISGGSTASGAGAGFDSDGDFSPDLEEQAAGTDPQDKQSAPVVLSSLILTRETKRYRPNPNGWSGYTDLNVNDGWAVFALPSASAVGQAQLGRTYQASLIPGTQIRTVDISEAEYRGDPSGMANDFVSLWRHLKDPTVPRGLPADDGGFGRSDAAWALYVPEPERRVSPTTVPFRAELITTTGKRYRLRGPVSNVDQSRTFLRVRWEKTWPSYEAYMGHVRNFGYGWYEMTGPNTAALGDPVSVTTETLIIPKGAHYSEPMDIVPKLAAGQFSDGITRLVVERLVPVEVLRGKPGTGEIAHADRLIEEAIPIPEVELHLGNVSISGNTITVIVSGTVKDPLSGLSGNPSDAPGALAFSALGASIGSIPLTSQVATGQAFSTTLSVPLTHDGSFVLRAETSSNSAGLKGFDQSAVSIRWNSSNVPLGTVGSSLKLLFPQAPLSTVVNVLQIQEGTDPLQTLTETGSDTGIYTGAITLGGASATCTVQMVNTPVLNGTVPDTLPAEIKIVPNTGAQSVITGIWRETGADTQLFADPSIVTQGMASASVGEVHEMRGTAKEGAIPFTVRLPGGILSDDIKLMVGGTEFPMKSFTIDGKTSFYPYADSQPGSPRLFLPSRHPVPANLAVPGFSSSVEGSALPIKIITGSGPATLVNTLFTVPSESPPDPLALAGSPPPAEVAPQQTPLPRWHEPGDAITMTDLLTAFRILYPDDEAQDLLAKFYAAGGVIKLEDISPDLKVSWWHPGASWAPIIKIEADDAEVGGQKYTPAGAANLLWRGLIQSLGSPAMAQQLDTDDLDWWIAHQQEYAKSAAEITVGATEIYLSGIGLLSEGADLILVISEVLDGNGKALVAALPFVSVGMYKYLKRTDGILKVAHPQNGSIAQMTNQQLSEFSEMYYLGNKLNGAAEVDFALLGPKLREWLTAPGGKIDPDEIGVHGKLRQEFEKISPAPSTNHHCHHDLPWDLRREFAQIGVNVNDPLFGRWMTKERHSQIHGSEGYNEWWKTWFSNLRGKVPSRPEILHQIALAHAAFPD
jgi:hypothetical protein